MAANLCTRDLAMSDRLERVDQFKSEVGEMRGIAGRNDCPLRVRDRRNQRVHLAYRSAFSAQFGGQPAVFSRCGRVEGEDAAMIEIILDTVDCGVKEIFARTVIEPIYSVA